MSVEDFAARLLYDIKSRWEDSLTDVLDDEGTPTLELATSGDELEIRLKSSKPGQTTPFIAYHSVLLDTKEIKAIGEFVHQLMSADSDDEEEKG